MTESLSLDRRNSTSTSSVKTRSKKKGDGRITSTADESATSRKTSDPYCTIMDKEQIEKRRSVVVQNHYNSLKLPHKNETVTTSDKQNDTTPTITSVYVLVSLIRDIHVQFLVFVTNFSAVYPR